MPPDLISIPSHIAVLGCGWLGLPLAQQLLSAGHQVTGSTRSAAKLASLKELGVDAVELELGDISKTSIERLTECSVWVINIPSGRRTIEPKQFVAQMQELIDHAIQSHIVHLIFVSSTSVYGDLEDTIIETSKPLPVTASAIAHTEIEQYIMTHLAEQSTIIRLAGLVDQQRHPVHYLANRSGLTAPNQAVNLIHKVDVCNALEKLIQLGPQSSPMHLAAPEHPSRQEYYQWAAAQLGLNKPVFLNDENTGITGKKIDASQTLATLGLSLQYASPYQMLG